MTPSIALAELVEYACQSGILDPLFDYLEETEHPRCKKIKHMFLISIQWELTHGLCDGVSVGDHLVGCRACKAWLKTETLEG